MSVHIDYTILEEFSKGNSLTQIQHVFNTFIYDLTDYLILEPLYQDIVIEEPDENDQKKGYSSILDFGIERNLQKEKLIITILLNEEFIKFLPFVLLREAYYCFIPYEKSEYVKICVNQIVENNLGKLSAFKDWKKFIRDSVVDKEFISTDLDRLQKFFKTEAKAPLESVTQFFFKEIRNNLLLCQNNNENRFYDIIFERYAYRTSRSLFNSEIIETLKIIIQIFYKTKSYLSLNDYHTLFKRHKENESIYTDLSLRKFMENIQWINKCSSIAPSYDYSYSTIGLYPILGIIRFNPHLERSKLKLLIEEWPFFYLSKFSVNSFALEISVSFHVPQVYLKDFLNYFNKLEESRYIIKKKLYYPLNKTDFINLNYYTDISNIDKITDPNTKNYEKKYEIEFNIEYPSISNPFHLSVLDYTILERVKHVSVTGLTFDKRKETLNALKEDVENELRRQININKDFKNSWDIVLNSPKLKYDFLNYLNINKEQGFFFNYIQLNHLLNYVELIDIILKKHREISNFHQLQEFLKTNEVFKNIEDQSVIRNNVLKKDIFGNLISLFFKSKTSYAVEVAKIQAFYDVFNACYNLKILNLNNIKKMVDDPEIIEEIYKIREKRYKNLFKPITLYKITNEKIESNIDVLLNYNPPILKPMLINTILTNTFAKYYPEVLLKDKPEVWEGINKLKLYFPRIYIVKVKDLNNNRNLIRLLIYLVNIKEKSLFISILWSYFKDSIIKMNHYFWAGVMRRAKYSARDFYDFENGNFLYSNDLYTQILKFSHKVLGDGFSWPKDSFSNNLQKYFWLEEKGINELVNSVKYRISHQEIQFNLKELDSLSGFLRDLKTNLLDPTKFNEFKTKKFFKRYINSIKFLPAFQEFGLAQYHLFLRPFDYNSVDFRHLLINSFQKVKYPASIEPNPAIFIQMIFPSGNPNKSYLNWLVKSKKNVSEYCLYFKKKIYEIFHFNRNLTKEGWNYSSIRYKMYIQNILFNQDYDPKFSGIRIFDLKKISSLDIYGYNTKEFESLTDIYNMQSTDIKSILGTKKYSKIRNFTDLVKKKLIFPYLSLKNLDFQDKISIILPEVKLEFNKKLLKIFSYFNFCRLYEIEGEFYIYGFEKEKIFENGFLIEIWFPKCELDEFLNVFDLIFEYLEIKHYLILTDLVKGETLLESVYGELDFLKEYNPLLNLIWNDKDKIWMNHKLFNEKFEPIYPDLIPKGTK